MTKSLNTSSKRAIARTDTAPELNLTKIGIVARDYRYKFSNGYRDFSHVLPALLKLLDSKGCDSVLFSLFSIIPRRGFDVRSAFNNLKNIKSIFIEEFKDGDIREAGRYVVYYKTRRGWEEYNFYQVFGTITKMPQSKIDDFVNNEVPKRILGNCCVLLCGEINGVKYSKDCKQVKDLYGLRAAIPKGVNIVLNPIHDRMTRFEMKLKRQFLSRANRLVISVWNKGKEDKRGKVKDGRKPPWTIFHNGNEKEVDRLQNEFGIEIGIFDTSNI